jgi:uncharacterized protein YdcH (DUF465 family)
MGTRNPKFEGKKTNRTATFFQLKMGQTHEDKVTGKIYMGWDDRSVRCLSDMGIKELAEADAQFSYMAERYALLRKNINVMVQARDHAAKATASAAGQKALEDDIASVPESKEA